jgi:hypothetical protein
MFGLFTDVWGLVEPQGQDQTWTTTFLDIELQVSASCLQMLILICYLTACEIFNISAFLSFIIPVFILILSSKRDLFMRYR